MASQLNSYTVQAPGFFGVNTQDALVDLSQNFALAVDNAIIDRYGRVGARKGWTRNSTALNADLGYEDVTCIGELITNGGDTYLLAAGNGVLMTLASGTLTTLTYGGGATAPSITADNWQYCQIANIGMFWQTGHDPLIYEPGVSTSTYRRLSERSGSAGTVYQCNAAIAAYGRVWAANTAADKSTVVFSDLLAPHVWTGGTSGNLNLREVWPKGGDEVVAFGAHNNFLYIFGKNQILIYGGADDPATMTLADSVVGVGCVARDSVQNTGDDILFLSASGVRSLQRTIQEKSQPMLDISANVRNEIIDFIAQEDTDSIKSVFSRSNAFYALTLPAFDITYCFDTRKPLEGGAARVTTWSAITPACYCEALDGTVYLGKAGCVATYAGYLDDASSYNLRYYTPWLDFGSPTALSIFKRAVITIVGGGGKNITSRWAFDYNTNYASSTYSVEGGAPSEYGVDEYGVAEFSGSAYTPTRVVVAGSRSGIVMQFGIDATINGFPVSIQRIDIYAKEGRT